jgi:trimeric autotransporter adhesin
VRPSADRMRVLTVATIIMVSFFGMTLVSGTAKASAVSTPGVAAGWTVQDRSINGTFNSVSCPSDDRCVAVGSAGPFGGSGLIGLTSDGGGSWTTEAAPTGAADPLSVTCGSATHCVAVGQGSVILSSHNAGKSWLTSLAPTGVTGLTSVSCASATHCIAVGSQTVAASTVPAVVATTDGRTWTNETPTGAGLPPLSAISCSSANHCVAVGGQLDVPGAGATSLTDDGGRTWVVSTSHLGDASGFTSVSCGSSTTCVAMGETIDLANVTVASSDGGATWAVVTSPGLAGGIDCLSATDCVAVGQTDQSSNTVAFITTDGGTAWSTQSMPLAVTGVVDVSCSSLSACVMIGTHIVTMDGLGFPEAIIAGSTTAFSGARATAITPSVSPTTDFGTVTTYTATVAPLSGSGTPTGTVSFRAGAVVLCTATLVGGSGSCSASNAPRGIDTITAKYGGAPSYFPSSAVASQDVGSISCAHATGSVDVTTYAFTVTLSRCAPVSKENRTGTLTGSIEGGTVVWQPSGQTTVGSLQMLSAPEGLCPKRMSELDVTGIITGGTSTYTVVGDAVTIHGCWNTTTNRVTLAKGTTAAF